MRGRNGRENPVIKGETQGGEGEGGEERGGEGRERGKGGVQ